MAGSVSWGIVVQMSTQWDWDWVSDREEGRGVDRMGSARERRIAR